MRQGVGLVPQDGYQVEEGETCHEVLVDPQSVALQGPGQDGTVADRALHVSSTGAILSQTLVQLGKLRSLNQTQTNFTNKNHKTLFTDNWTDVTKFVIPEISVFSSFFTFIVYLST